MKRHEIQVLRRAGVTIRQIAEQAGVSPSTIKRIVRESAVEAVDDRQLTSKHGVGRPSKTEEFRNFADDLLEREPKLPTIELLHRARLAGYEGGKSAFYELVSELRANTVSPLVRFEGLPGEFSQHDFGEVDVRYLDGSQERIRFFASRLKYSRWSEIRLVPDERVESLVRSLLSSFEAWGGIPLVAVFDNPKTVVIGRKQKKIEWNRTFGQVALDYRFAPELCTPRRAQEKGSVENLVGWVKGSFFKVRRFHDREDLEHQLEGWHREVNHERPSRATGVIPAERMQTERERLRPWPFRRWTIRCASRSWSARPARCATTRFPTRCIPSRSVSPARCIYTSTACESSPAGTRPSTNAIARVAANASCPVTVPRCWPRSRVKEPSCTSSDSSCSSSAWTPRRC